MKGVYYLLLLMSMSLYISCNELVEYYGSAKYQAYHLINTYVDTNAPKLSCYNNGGNLGVEIGFMNEGANFYYSKEFADVSQKNQSEEQLRTFINLAGKNNDSFQWTPWYETFGESRKHQGYYQGGTLYALTKGIIKIDIVSDADYDQKHLAGVSLMDNVKLAADIFGNVMGKTSLPADFWQDKMYSEYTAKELSVVGTWIILKFATLPTLSKTHNLTIAITFDDGEVYTDTVEVNF